MSLSAVPRSGVGVLARPRLVVALDDAAPLVVLHAPMGYGKTVAMAQWARSTGHRGVWMRVRDGGGEPRPFVQQLAAQLADAGLLEDGNPLRTAAETLAVDDDPWGLLARGLRRRPGPLAIALDDGDRLSEATVRGLIDLLADVPGLLLRVAVRRVSLFTEPSLAVMADAVIVGRAELALTASEALELTGDAATADEIVAAAGVPALARMLALGEVGASEKNVEQAARSLLRLRGGNWDDAFVGFLETVAVADALDVRLAEAISGRSDALRLLETAEAEGLGSWETPGPRDSSAVFVFSPFLRLAAEESLRRERSRPEVREIIRRVARWELERGLAFSALRRAAEIDDAPLADEVLRRHWNELLSYRARLTELFAHVPLLSLRTRPLVAMVLAIVANASGTQRLRALEYFGLAIYGARMQRATAPPADRVLLRAIETTSYRVSGRSGALAAARDGYRALQEMDAAERDRLGRNEPTVYNQIGTSLFYGGLTAEALDCFRRSTAVSDAKGLFAGLQGLALTAGTLAVTGEVDESREVIDEALSRAWPERWIDGYPGSFLQLARGFSALEDGDPDAADAAIRLLDPHRATIEHWPLLTHLDVLVALARGRTPAAHAVLSNALRTQQARHATSELTLSRLRHTRALVLLAAGDAAGAERVVAKDKDPVRRGVSLGRIALAAGDVEGAVRLLQASAGMAASARIETEHLALTVGALALGAADQDGARRTLGRLVAVLDQRGLLVPLAMVPANALDAMAEIAVDPRARELIARARRICMVPATRRRVQLTPREIAVADELTRSETVAEIAAALVVSPNTVKSQLRSLYRKLGVSSRADALRALAALDLRGQER
ncbi:LuxR family maltose regulon positive regulatory protein [Microbacterium sp. SORGH_AS428]|uniref:LuxR C-terminal-related transcriptional regulator n=1 Tax=Microbacterium sp. SORGH_AS_0428 TaxID=3041788 RepID=UPI0028548C08|nr:LuxR C-terminal-related transcriptional regulator [Microbacterium sp. SORGH_AS_0428]MDR6199254.1 LuxR family maltose regulon positive regulatory protein [Microbacterium sp. SORGH_AS_0428]